MIDSRRGLLAAVLVSAAIISARELEYANVRYDRFHVPAFDGHVYIAMAESPRFFTVAPWGYRILNPWLIAILPFADVVPAFFWMTVLGLTLAGALLFLYLRRLGHGVLASLLGVVLFGASAPVGEAVRYQFLCEPLSLALELTFLLALESGAGPASLALVAALGALSKEFFVFLLPLAYLVLRAREGGAAALRTAAITAAPALLATLALRLWWTPHIHPPLPGPSALGHAFERLRESWREWWAAALLMGLTPLAVLGGLRSRARPHVAASAYLFLAALLSPLLNPVTFHVADIRRHLLYALPAVVPLALLALDRVFPHMTAPPRPELSRRRRWVAAALTAGCVALPLLVVDRYRRADLQGVRDAPLVLALFRETLRTGEEIERGSAFVFDPTSGRFSRGMSDASDLSELRRVRWFLREGWGPSSPREGGDAAMQGREASILLPCLRPRALEVGLALDAPTPARLLVLANGRPVGDLLVGIERRETTLRIPAEVLYRGDNFLTFSAPEGSPPRARLLGLKLRAGGGS